MLFQQQKVLNGATTKFANNVVKVSHFTVMYFKRKVMDFQ